MKAGRVAILVAVGFTLLTGGASASAAGLAGTYTDNGGVTQLVFKNGRVTITRLGIMQGIFKYTLDGKEITVAGANSGQAMLLEIDDKGCIIGVPGAGELCRAGANVDTGASTNASSLSGTYASNDPVQHDEGQIAFHGDGTVEITHAGDTVKTTYIIKDKTVTILPPEGSGESEPLVLKIDDEGCLYPPNSPDNASNKICKQ